MIAHVAEAGESKGRVVLQLCSNRPSRFALEAAIRIAQAYHSEIESLFVEDQDLIQLAHFPFAREIVPGGTARGMSLDGIEREIRNSYNGLQRQIELLAANATVPVKHRVVREYPMQALQNACAESGPWNLVALADPVTPGFSDSLRQLFGTVTGATGMVVVGPGAKRSGGRIVVVGDEADHLPNMLRFAQRLAALDDAEVALVLISGNEEALQNLEESTRTLLSDKDNVVLGECAIAHTPAAASEVLRRLTPGFAISRYGGLLVPAEGSLDSLTVALECPLLLVK